MNKKKSKFEYTKIRYDEISPNVWQVVIELERTPRDGIVYFPFGQLFAFPSRKDAEAETVHFIEEVERYPLSWRQRICDRLVLDAHEKAHIRKGGTKESFKKTRDKMQRDWKKARSM